MQVDITFEFAKAYNVEKIDVVKGQKFTINTDYTEPSKWFSDSDPVLSLVVDSGSAEAEAKELGLSTILIMNSGFEIQKTLTIKVVSSIEPMATALDVTTGESIEK
jgi:hypothetical protein